MISCATSNIIPATPATVFTKTLAEMDTSASHEEELHSSAEPKQNRCYDLRASGTHPRQSFPTGAWACPNTHPAPGADAYRLRTVPCR